VTAVTDVTVTDVTDVTLLTGVEAARLLKAVEAILLRYVRLPSDEALHAIALWVLHTWAIEGAHATPYLSVSSAEKQSGKTRLLEVLSLLVRNPWHTASATEAALFRKIEQDTPTLLLDEIDAIFGSNSERTEPLRAVLNAGNRRGATATRVVGKGTDMQAKDFSVFCPKVLAGIDTGRLPDTIRDRSIEIPMKRRHDEEQVARLRFRQVEEATVLLRARLEKWAAAAANQLREANPHLPDSLGDRAADAWEPLLAIADHAEGEWPDLARDAALALLRPAGDETSRGALLLSAIRTAMAGEAQIFTETLLARINSDDELPFGGWSDGRGLDPRSLARLLKPYGVRPATVRQGADTAKGYTAEALSDAWSRYIPPGKSVTTVTAVTTPAPPPAEHEQLQAQVHEIGNLDPLAAEQAWSALERDLARQEAHA